jgi:hypothetical protein
MGGGLAMDFTVISLLTLKRRRIILTKLKIQRQPSFQDSKISISTSQNITLKRGENHQKMQHQQLIQTMIICLISWI